MVPEQTLRSAMRVQGTQQRVLELLDLIADQEILDVIDNLAMGYLGEILGRWEVQSGITCGEVFHIVTTLGAPSRREALSADLIKAGMRLRNFPSPEHTWADLKIFIRYLDVHSALYGMFYPDKAGWDRQNMLLADISDRLNWLQWSKTKDGSRGRNRPKPIPRPGYVTDQREGARVKAAPVSQIAARMAKKYADDYNNAPAKKKRITAGLGRRLPVAQPKSADRITEIANAFHGNGRR